MTRIQLPLNIFLLLLLLLVRCESFAHRRFKRYLGAAMGLDSKCDDAKTNLTVDWDQNFNAYLCPTTTKFPVTQAAPIYYKQPGLNPKTDVVYHYCMNTSISYEGQSPPLRGDHRPAWALYGEYLYIPPQRWLHNLEHGSIIALYHPCADEHQVEQLRKLVVSCLYRHIITPYNKLSADRPLALVAWGVKLEMSSLDIPKAVDFMQRNAHVAPEDLSTNGYFSQFLIKPAKIVSDIEDSRVCAFVQGK